MKNTITIPLELYGMLKPTVLIVGTHTQANRVIMDNVGTHLALHNGGRNELDIVTLHKHGRDRKVFKQIDAKFAWLERTAPRPPALILASEMWDMDDLQSLVNNVRDDDIAIGSLTKLPCQYSECTADYRKYSEIYN